VTFTAVSIGAYLERFVSRDIADFLAPFLATLSIVIPDVCSNDPPTTPNLDASDFIALVNFTDPLAQLAANDKLRDWFVSLYWCNACKCDNGTIPTCSVGSVASAPAGSDTGLPQGSGGGHCWDVTSTFTDSGGGSPTDLTAQALPQTSTVSVTGSGGGFPTTAQVMPAGVSNFHGTYNVSADPGGDHNLSVYLQAWNSAGTQVLFGTAFNVNNSGASGTWSVSIPGTASSWAFVSSGNSNGITKHFTVEVIFDCTGSNPNMVTQACCPPDQNLSQVLAQILNWVQLIYSTIPIRAPNYASGTTHAALSLNGTISLNPTTIAVQLTFTTIPGNIGSEFGMPVTYFGLGWITPVTNEGAEAGLEVTRSVQVIELPAATSALDYTFTPGAVVTVAELQAG
jgi:hypothetical protein